MGAVREFVHGFDWFVLVYFLTLNSIYLALILLAAYDIAHLIRRESIVDYDDMFANPLTPPVSIVVPAYNEEAVILDSVHAMLALRYPEFEVIVVDDGSTDGTFDLLAEAFELRAVERVIPNMVPTIGRVLSVHVASSGEPLVVVRKENAGRRSDTVNVGIDLARYPLVCMVDADSILEDTALLRAAKPFVDDPQRVVAVGGVIRTANGSDVYRGRVEDARMPKGWLPRIQTVEYLRSFLLGRLGWSRLQGLLIISGAFGIFRRDVVIAARGLDLESLGEDAELVTTVHEYLRRARRDYRIVFVPEPVCWTEVPETLSQLGSQRRRWSRGLAQLLRKHRRMIGNPRYGRIGLVVLPYYLAFELLGPVVEVVGLGVFGMSIALGAVGGWFALAFAAAAIGYGLILSVCALAIEEFAFHRYRRWTDLQRAFAAAIVENLGYRQMHAWWRLQGLMDEIVGRRASWGTMTRQGFTSSSNGTEAAPDAAAEKVSA